MLLIKVEFEYNPYIMDYSIKFNGVEPRINSMIEQYLKEPLQVWVKEIPSIFYNEMNGYDFVVEFTGTRMDYEKVINAFKRLGIDKEVKFEYKKEISSRKENLGKILELKEWLENTRNPRFDYDAFKIENSEKLDDMYPIVVLGESEIGKFVFDNLQVSVELINNINDLEKTELQDTPIIVDCETPIFGKLLENIRFIVSREDVREEQIFFLLVHNQKEIERILMDFGIKKPNIIKEVNNNELNEYFEFYPASNHIRKVIEIYRKTINSQREILKNEMEESQRINGEVLDSISVIEKFIEQLKDGIKTLEEMDDNKLSDEVIDETIWGDLRNNFVSRINNWKIKKTKITGSDEGLKLANNFNEEVQFLYDNFYDKLLNIYDEEKTRVLDEIASIYTESSKERFELSILDELEKEFTKEKIPNISSGLMDIREEAYEKQREGLLDSLFGTGLSNDGKEVLVIRYDCQEWREYVVDLVSPIIDTEIVERTTNIDDIKHSVVQMCIQKMKEILDTKESEKEQLSGQLSEDNRILQKYSDWLQIFDTRLKEIEGR